MALRRFHMSWIVVALCDFTNRETVDFPVVFLLIQHDRACCGKHSTACVTSAQLSARGVAPYGCSSRFFLFGVSCMWLARLKGRLCSV